MTMKKRLLSILLMCCMVLTLLPTTAFAEESTETPPVCSCETACTAESRNAECPVCGAEGADPENCKCAQPEEEMSDSQPEKEVSDPQPETALTALIGGSETERNVSSADELTKAIADTKVNTVKLAGDIIISSSLTVNRTMTLDLNGHVLKYESENNGSVIVVEGSGQLTIDDSNTSNLSHKFMPNGKLWVLDDASGTEAVTGGVITGGTGTDLSTYGGTTWYCGGGALIKNGGSLTMRGGNIIGCSAECGGGVCVDSGRNGEPGQFSMSGGSIIGCVASNSGGGVFASGKFQMSGKAVIRSCTVESTIQLICGGGVYVNGSSSFEMSGEAKIEGCQAISTSAYGGGVYVSSSSSFVMTDKAEIEGCRAIANSNSSKGGGVHLANNTKFTLSGSAVIQNCTATNSANPGEAYGGGVSAACVKEITLADSARIAGCTAANGSGLYITGSLASPDAYGKLYANGGSVDGDVVLGDKDKSDGPCTITGTGETVFNGKVTVTPDSIIEKGTFNGDVINNGTITGGVFNSTVSGSGTIEGGTFNTPITGSGTESDPYQISTADQLKRFRDIVNGSNGQTPNRGACAVLTANIDLNNEPWTPIGQNTGDDPKDTLAYSGTFNGNGHTISGLNVTGEFAYSGLFGYTEGAAIRDLTVAGKVTSTSTDSSTAVGGIIGRAKGSTIENCGNLCAVTAPAGHTGGIVGYAAYMDDSSGWITGCYNAGKISGGDYAGGIVGTHYDDMFIYDCYNVGAISGNCAIGGIAGSASFVMLFNCYNAGIVVCPGGTATPGGLFGSGSGQVRNSYYLKGTTADSHIGAIEKSAEEFADGTVLKALKDGKHKSEDPWADECQYVDAAGLTLPVFKNQNTHKHQDPLEHVPAKAPTTSADGNIEYWYCPACGRYFADANGDHEITQAETVIPKRHFSGSSSSSYPITVPDKTENGSVAVSPKTASKGSTVTITVTPDSGYVLETISVTDKNGNDLKLTDKGNGKYTFTMPGGKVEVKVTFMEDNSVLNFFYDVPNDAYYYEAVKWAAENGITGGVGNSLFAPNQPCTRAQIVTFLWRAAGSPAPKSMSSFTDVPADAFYAKAVAWAVENGITSGTGEGKFSPNAICTRAQSVTFLYRASGSPAVSGSAEFSDVSTTAFYADAVAWAAKKGITTGIGGGLFDSDNDCTRSQIVTFLWRCKK
jgi:hypothetical protein